MTKANRPQIPQKTIINLWMLGGGRCYFCNKPLWRDDYTMAKMNRAYIAHIIDVHPQTHRYDPILSPQLAKDISNLMLMCDEHHRMIDREQEADFTVARLRSIKIEHEKRIELLTSIKKDAKSHLLLYGANIGKQASPLTYEQVVTAIIPDLYPADSHAIELSLKGSQFKDNEDNYWIIERENLKRQFDEKVKPRLESNTIKHLSVFALAPQPLLIELGHLLSDIPSATVYQRHREPATWEWCKGDEFEYEVKVPSKKHYTVALNLSLSADIVNTRITDVLGPDVSIWTITVPAPHNDFLRSQEHLASFRKLFRQLMNIIKREYPQATHLNIFLACPVSISVEIGRCRMPKADLPLKIYDENRNSGGFIHAFTIGEKEEIND